MLPVTSTCDNRHPMPDRNRVALTGGTEVPVAGCHLRQLIRRYPVTSFYIATLAISWTGALMVAIPNLARHQAVPKSSGLLMFPIMLLGPSVAGLAMTRIVDGRRGVRDLLARMRCPRVHGRWYLVLLIPPALVLAVLLALQSFVAPVFAPNRFFIGLSFGVAAGFFEEIGWMGYAFPKLRRRRGTLTAGILLGLLWGLWHLPVIDYLGTATPHAPYLLAYFLAFAAAMMAIRILIAWLYDNTSSVLLAQLMHASSTGALVAFSPPGVTAAQETFWYAVYACALWSIVACLIAINDCLRRAREHS